MKTIKHKVVVGFFFLLAFSGYAQEMLMLEEAISTAMENNYDIKLEKYNEEVSENNVSRAISGQMPRLDFTTAYEWGYAETETQTQGLTQSPEGGNTTSPPLSFEGTSEDITIRSQLTVPIFEGFRRRYRFKQLETDHEISELQLTRVMERTISRTVSAYLEVARWQSRLEIDRENIAISHDRWQRVSQDAQFGAANTVLRLQAEVDLKTDSANYRTSTLAYENSRRDLNLIMAQPPEKVFMVQEDMVLSNTLDYESLRTDMRAHNTQLSISGQTIELAEYEVEISKSTFAPNINGYANYTYFETEDEANFISNNQVYGPNVGVTLSWAVFTGGANKIRRQNAAIGLEQQQTAYENTSLTLEKSLNNAYARYLNNRDQLRIEQSNLKTYQLNYEKINEDYKLGLVDANALRTAQLNLSSAKNRINDLTYNVKQSEITLLELSGRLTE